MKLRWEDAEDIAEQLFQVYPDTDPLGVRFTDLHRRVTGLKGFDGDPQESSEGKLEAIQMAWLELYKEQSE
jgi:FeS assembly protein IscX